VNTRKQNLTDWVIPCSKPKGLGQHTCSISSKMPNCHMCPCRHLWH